MDDLKALIDNLEFSRPKILIVDDSATCRALMEHAFEKRGWNTQCAVSGEHALGILANDAASFDAAFVDENMLGMPGHKLVAAIHDLYRHIVTVLISGDSRPAELSKGCGWFFIEKPLEKHQDQLDEVANLIGQHA